MIRSATLVFLAGLLLCASSAIGAVIQTDTIWSGEIVLMEDTLVPEGVTLTIQPGTTVRVIAAESTRTDPEFMSPLTELMVRGRLIADGKAGAPVTFKLGGDRKSSWAGIIVDNGKAILRSVVINDADTGVLMMAGTLSLSDSLLTGNRYGITALGSGSTLDVNASRVTGNEYGMVLLNGATVRGANNDIRKNTKKDTYTAAARGNQITEKGYHASSEGKEKTRTYSDETLLGTTIWQGRIEVNGIIRIPENARLVIMPGTVVEFRKKDTNNDNIGENGLLIQGGIVAKGSPENPIVLRSAEAHRSMGDWDSINIMNSDQTQNLIEYCQIEDAFRGLHFHFSNVMVVNTVLKNNYRGIQFQESVVEIAGTRIYGNKSAVQARDSEVLFSGNTIHDNYTGMNLFRNSVTVRGSTIVSNYQEGIRVREGLPVFERNLLDGNRHGLMLNDVLYGTFDRNVITHNAESGISLKNTDTVEISGNVIQANGINGINVQDSSASILGNFISDNGERGIGVQSFQGIITGNTIVKNGLYNLGIEGTTDVSARMNWWGGGDVKKTIYDKENDPSKGKADYLPTLERPVLFSWPLRTIRTDTAWHDHIAVNDTITVEPATNLVLSANTRVLFSKGAGLVVKGRILARGERAAEIFFASAQGTGPSEWDEILLDHAQGSAFTHALFSNATWALHSHFTDLKVDACSFTDNMGGIRFTSGPIEVTRSFFSGNDMGIRSYRGKAIIAENVITANRIGIFVREKGSGLRIKNNNFFDNTDYSIRMGDFNTEDVEAGNNWWGDQLPSAVIYDARTEPGIGTVRDQPYADRPFPLGQSYGNVRDKKRAETGPDKGLDHDKKAF